MDTNDLCKAALDARLRAHAPYSRFQVGAALLTTTGRAFAGCNVENASLGLSICAERAAVFNAVTEGETRFQAIAIASEGAVTPCGACRQVLAEFAPDLEIHLVNLNGERRTTTLRALLPDAFNRF